MILARMIVRVRWTCNKECIIIIILIQMVCDLMIYPTFISLETISRDSLINCFFLKVSHEIFCTFDKFYTYLTSILVFVELQKHKWNMSVYEIWIPILTTTPYLRGPIGNSFNFIWHCKFDNGNEIWMYLNHKT